MARSQHLRDIQGTFSDHFGGLGQGCFATYSPLLISAAASVPSVIERIKAIRRNLVLIPQCITLI